MKVLVLSPHADDAELGAGGSIARFIEEGHDIRWIVFSRAEESLPEGAAPDTLEREFRTNTDALGLTSEQVRVHQYRVRRLHEHRQEILEELVKERNEYHPDLVLAPSQHDHHQDHQVVSNEAVRAFKTSASLLCYELPWNHLQFDTQFFVRLDNRHIDQKFALLQNYQSQLDKNRKYFSHEFVYGLASVRGTQCNAAYAESFEVLRWMHG